MFEPHFIPVTPLCSVVRQKTKELLAFIQDDEKVRDERKRAKASRDKYVGYSSQEAVGGRYSRFHVYCLLS